MFIFQLPKFWCVYILFTSIYDFSIFMEFFMIQGSKYIGQGYVMDYLVKSYLQDKFSITSFNNSENNIKINFIVNSENEEAKLGVHLTISSDDNKISGFLKRKSEILEFVNKILYIHINLSLHENEKLDEYSLITNILQNITAVIKNAISDVDDVVVYQISPYGMEKKDINRLLSGTADIPSYNNNNEKVRNEDYDDDPKEASIIRIKGKLIVVELESGSTHVGVVDYDANNKEAIIEEMRNAETNMYGRLDNCIRVLVKMEPNKEPGRPDMARIVALR